ncbi:MAG TPA: M48 family metallopeptidase [Jiangellaceae bacterium]|nr:M48 family metallopeptidase [Jiangellaceae bacterium]
MRSSGAAGWIVAVVLLAGFVIIVFSATPWQPFPDANIELVPADPDRDFTAAEQAAAAQYRSDSRPAGYLNLVTGLVVALVLGLTTLGAWIVEMAARPLGGGWVWQVVLGGLAVLLVMRVATLPFSAWAESVRRTYGLSTRNWAGWFGDIARSFGLQTTGTLLALLALVALARVWPRWWWVPAAGGAAALVVVLSFLYPLVVEPVFNKFTPMPEGELRTSLIELAQRDGVDVDEVLVADASRRTTTLNAYVSGFGATHRIVVYDTLLDQAPDDEIRSIVAHELGHTVDNDVRNGTLMGALAAAAGVCVLAGLLTLRWPLERSGATGPADPRSIALILAIVTVLGLVAAPVQNLVSRRVETRADVHSLGLTGDPATFVETQRNLAVTAYSDPNPPAWLFALFYSHPTHPQRIALARTWAQLNGVPEPADLVKGE